MRYLILHNRYSRVGGEESMVKFQVDLLRRAGHEVMLYERSYEEMKQWRFGRLSGLFSSLYNRRSVRDVKRILKHWHPDVAIVHNLFPVISPAVVPLLKRGGVRVLMAIHNFRLICPTGLFFTAGELCERCGTGWCEWNCVRRRCEGSLWGSCAYAMRTFWARMAKSYLKNVDYFLVQSAFHADKLSAYGVPQEKMRVVHNGLAVESMLSANMDVQQQGYVAFVGRLSAEKGVDLFFAVARLLPGVPFRVAGESADGFTLADIPANVELVGFLDRQQLADFYTGSQLLLHTSRCYEGGITLTVLESMFYSRPVVAQDIGASAETLGDGRYGLLAPYGDAERLAACVRLLSEDAALRHSMGTAAHDQVMCEYNDDVYLQGVLRASR